MAETAEFAHFKAECHSGCGPIPRLHRSGFLLHNKNVFLFEVLLQLLLQAWKERLREFYIVRQQAEDDDPVSKDDVADPPVPSFS